MSNFVSYSFILSGESYEITEAIGIFKACAEGHNDSIPQSIAVELYSDNSEASDWFSNDGKNYFEVNDDSIRLRSTGFGLKLFHNLYHELFELGDLLVELFPHLGISGYIHFEGEVMYNTYSPPGTANQVTTEDVISYLLLPYPLPTEHSIDFNTMTQVITCPHCSTSHTVDLKAITDAPFNDKCYEHYINDMNNYVGDFITHCPNKSCYKFFYVNYSSDDGYYFNLEDCDVPLSHLINCYNIPDTYTSIVTPGYEPFCVEGNHIKKLYIKNNGDLIIPEGITHIEANAFEECTIGKLTMPSTLVDIGNNVFYNCIVKELVIPDSITELKDRTFRSATVGTLTLPSRLKAIGENCFKGSDISTLTIPMSVKTIGKDAFGRGTFTDLHFPNSSATFEKSIGIPKATKVYTPATSPIGIYTKKGNTGGILQ